MGLPFLKCPFEEWPVKTECNVKHSDLPDKVNLTVNLTIADEDSDGASYIYHWD